MVRCVFVVCEVLWCLVVRCGAISVVPCCVVRCDVVALSLVMALVEIGFSAVWGALQFCRMNLHLYCAVTSVDWTTIPRLVARAHCRRHVHVCAVCRVSAHSQPRAPPCPQGWLCGCGCCGGGCRRWTGLVGRLLRGQRSISLGPAIRG